ncbi:MAG: hypothetical protein OSB62_05100 [Alphaproteobacteria bacterium]|nr:hypothetical protein [Alphaproteobacteria bacterium]
MKSLGFMQNITIRLTFDPAVSLTEAERALFEKAYYKTSAIQLAYNMCSTWQKNLSLWLERHVVSVRHEPYSNSLIVKLESYVFAASEFVGLIMDVLTVLICPPCAVGPLPDEFILKKVELFVDAYQPEWFAVLINEPVEGQFYALFEPVVASVLLEFPWEQGKS